MLRLLLITLAAALLTACGSVATLPALPRAADRDGLAGQIWDVHAQRPVTRDELMQQTFEARFVLLGEIHNNADHHRIQHDVLKSLLAKGARPTLAMEQLDAEYQTAIDQALAAPGVSGDSVAAAGHFDRKSWGNANYGPLIAMAVGARLPIAAMNLSRGEARRVASSGFTALGDGRSVTLQLDGTWNAAREATLRQEILDAHCGQLPDSALPGMVMAQRARDAVMADVLLNRTTGSAVAILGRGHARNDVGVPLYLAQRMPRAKLVSIGLVEVDQKLTSALDYFAANTEGSHFDYVWLTTRAARGDPCAELRLPAVR